MSEELRVKLAEYLEGAIEARFDFSDIEFGAGPVELHSALVDVQSHLTKLERFLSDSIRVKAALDRKESHAKMVWQEAFDKALTTKKPNFGADFVTGKEKIAEANLATFNELRVLNRLQEAQSFANEAVDVIRLHYYGLDKVRQDIRKRLDLSQSDYYAS